MRLDRQAGTLILCALLWTDIFPMPRDVVGNELATWHSEIRVQLCNGYGGPSVLVEGRVLDRVGDDEREVQPWKEIKRTRLQVTPEP